MITASLLTKAKTSETQMSINLQMDKATVAQPFSEYYSWTKKNELLVYRAGINTKGIIVNEIIQKQRL